MRLRLLAVLLTAVLPLAAGQAKNPAGHFLQPAEFVFAGVLPPPPAPGSVAAMADLETIFQVQRERTPEQVAWAKMVERQRAFDIAPVIGPWFTAENLPFTAEFLHELYQDCHAISERAKHLYERPRPPLADPAVHACVSIPSSTSYPSGHSMNAFIWAGVLGEIYPERKAELEAWAHHYAWGRIIGGVHFPSDDVGGRLLAHGILQQMEKSPAFRQAVEKARAEALPYLQKKAA